MNQNFNFDNESNHGRTQRIYVRKWYENPAVIFTIIGCVLAIGGVIVYFLCFAPTTTKTIQAEDVYELDGSDSDSSEDRGHSGETVSMSQVSVSSDITCCATTRHSTSFDTNMLDGIPTTAWQIPGTGVSRDVTATFKLPRACRVSEIRIRNGYQKRTSLFYGNSRPSWVRIVLINSSGNKCVYYDGVLKDVQGWQSLEGATDKARKFAATKILMTINTSRIYRGNKYTDIVISDVDFNIKAAR